MPIYKIEITNSETNQTITRLYGKDFFTLSSEDGWLNILDMFNQSNDKQNKF